MDAVDGLNAAVAAVLVVSLLIGLWRGLVFEVLSLLMWLVAWVVAHAFAGWAADWQLWSSWAPALRHAVGWVIVFVLALMAGRLVVWSIQQLLHMSPLAGIDRVLGGLFGLLRGALIVLVVVMLVGESPLARREAWQQALAVQWSQRVLAMVLPLMPGQWSVRGPETSG